MMVSFLIWEFVMISIDLSILTGRIAGVRALAVLFLAGREASYITGATLEVTGGL